MKIQYARHILAWLRHRKKLQLKATKNRAEQRKRQHLTGSTAELIRLLRQ